jgi:hypothetical protein
MPEMANEDKTILPPVPLAKKGVPFLFDSHKQNSITVVDVSAKDGDLKSLKEWIAKVK